MGIVILSTLPSQSVVAQLLCLEIDISLFPKTGHVGDNSSFEESGYQVLLVLKDYTAYSAIFQWIKIV